MDLGEITNSIAQMSIIHLLSATEFEEFEITPHTLTILYGYCLVGCYYSSKITVTQAKASLYVVIFAQSHSHEIPMSTQ
jgi:hypothetical protein